MNIEQIKEQITCLDYLGKPLRKTSAGWYLYRCPWREDKNPSLNVSPDGKVWIDKSDSGKNAAGNIIKLVQKCLGTTDFSRVCAAIDSSSFLPSNSYDRQKEKEIVEGTTFHSFSVVPLKSKGLYAYLTKRCVDTHIARQFLQEAHYSFQKRQDGRYLYALAYANDKGGYELRGAPYAGNPDGYKGGTSPKWITTHLGIANAATVVFEGFMDMLSWVTWTNGVKHNLVVMNSVTNKEETVEVLRSISGTIYLCLDNDKAGNDATIFIQNALPSAIDSRSHFAPAKDVNEFLVKHIKHKCGI